MNDQYVLLVRAQRGQWPKADVASQLTPWPPRLPLGRTYPPWQRGPGSAAMKKGNQRGEASTITPAVISIENVSTREGGRGRTDLDRGGMSMFIVDVVGVDSKKEVQEAFP